MIISIYVLNCYVYNIIDYFNGVVKYAFDFDNRYLKGNIYFINNIF